MRQENDDRCSQLRPDALWITQDTVNFHIFWINLQLGWKPGSNPHVTTHMAEQLLMEGAILCKFYQNCCRLTSSLVSALLSSKVKCDTPL